MSAITHLIAGVPVSDLDASIDWYTRSSGDPRTCASGRSFRDIDEHATSSLSRTRRSGWRGPDHLAVTGLDALLERLADQRIEHEPIETYSNASAT